MTDKLQKKLTISQVLFLPFWWYHITLGRWYVLYKKNENYNPYDCLKQSVINAVCHFDRSYIDKYLEEMDIKSLPEKHGHLAYWDIGTALFDLGHRHEGIEYLENAVTNLLRRESLAPLLSHAFNLICFRLNEKIYWHKRLRYAQEANKYFPKDILNKRIMVKSYIDLEMFNRAEEFIHELTSEEHEEYSAMLAELYYEKGDYESSVCIYDKYRKYFTEDRIDWLRAQCDYKIAAACYKINKTKAWKNQAKKIGRRIAWDKYYGIDHLHLEDEGVKRIPEIDNMIEFYKNKRTYFDFAKARMAAKRLPRVLLTYCQIHSVTLWFCLVGFFFFVPGF